MCLPHGLLQKIVLYSSWVILLTGLLSTVGAVLYSISINKIEEDIKAGNSDVTLNGFVAIVYINSILITLFSISGIVGAKCKNNCLLTCFNIGNCCCFCDFLVLTILFAIGTVLVPASKSSCLSNDNDKAYLVASMTLCHSGCECYYSGKITPELEPYIVEYSTTDQSKPVRYQDCPSFLEFGKPDYYNKLENEYDCSGWCKGYPIKLFSDVNSKVDEKSPCYDVQLDVFRSTFEQLATASYLIAVLFFVVMILTCCLCCHPNTSSYSNIYDMDSD